MDRGYHHLPQLAHHSHVATGHVGIVSGGTDRFPQWSVPETREFLTIRADLDPAFMETRRNRFLWELVSTRMKEKGYNRSPDQCKCKWKNLVTRYKGRETMEAAGMRQQQFPFYNEMQTIFNARMQRMLWLEAGAAGGAGSSSKKKAAAQFENGESQGGKCDARKKKKMKGIANPARGSSENSSTRIVISGVLEMMDEFMKQQMELETQWVKAFEDREEERRVKEVGWRQAMEALENERKMMDRRWSEREEEWKIKEEARAQKTEALITALLNKLRRQNM